MTVFMQDPHPGRCLNFRVVGLETLRCLDYEDTDHVCSFPEPRPTLPQALGGYNTQPAREPHTWVKP